MLNRVSIRLQIVFITREQESALSGLGIEQGQESCSIGLQQVFGLRGTCLFACP